MNLKKTLKSMAIACAIMVFTTTAVFAASQALNGGSMVWTGGEDIDGILFSQIVDAKSDGLACQALVCVKSDDGIGKSVFGATHGVGSQIYVDKAATHVWPFIPERSWFDQFKVY